MGSLIPFPDLNLFPHPAAGTAAVTRIKPKIEPIDEPFHNFLQPQQPSLYIGEPNLIPNYHPNKPLSESNSDPQAGVEEGNVYSEFYRIEEMFRSAFAKGLQKHGDGDVEADGDVLDPDYHAIVPVPEQNQLSTTTSQRRYKQRSSELVRVTDLSDDDEKYFRSVVRSTRLIYDSLRVFSSFDDEKRLGLGFGRRTRIDLRAAKAMKERGLWLNRDKRIVGAIPGIQIGDIFFFRMELCLTGMHGQAQAGIDYLTASQSPNGEPITTSIVVSGGYEDDEDSGDVIIYTGHGGQDKHLKQCVHQKLEGGNLGLERSMHYGIEVRVIRGFKYEGSASGKVYVYDGLYNVSDSWFDVGKSGFGVYKFKLIRIENQPEMGTSTLRFAQNLRSLPLAIRPTGYVSLDISMNKETVPVYLFNDIDDDNEPLYYDYLVTTVFPPYAYQIGGIRNGCDCASGCFDNCICALRNGGEFAYDRNGILVRGKPLIFECGPYCNCPPNCRNRVTQKGVRNRFEVFRSKETGWGVRSLDLIQAGSFICEYTGVVLTREQAQIISMNGDSLVYPNRFAERWTEWGDLSQVFSDYVKPVYPSIPPLDFAMDVSRMRNVACYISQSTVAPNVFVQLVLYDHNNVSFPHLMLFAMENIPPLRELCLDYGVAQADEWEVKLPICN